MDIDEDKENITPKKIYPIEEFPSTQPGLLSSQQSSLLNGEIDLGDLLPLSGNNCLKRYKLIMKSDGSLPISVGRMRTCHIVVPELIVSGQHCRFIKKGESLLIEDLSTNGTYLNGRLIGKGKCQTLKNSDKIGLGKVSGEVDLTYLFHASRDFLKMTHAGSAASQFLWEQKGIKKQVLLEYDFIKELGTGTFSVVYEGIQKTTGRRVAIKFVDLSKFTSEPRFQIQLNREIEILKQTSHENIIAIYDIFYSAEEQHLFFVLELADGGELYEKIGFDFPLLNEEEARSIFRQLLGGVHYLHRMGIAHRDLKPENILFASTANGDHGVEPKVKISDFGLARFINEGELAKTLCGTPLFVAPEVIVSKTKHQAQKQDYLSPNGYGKSCDAWSLGAILYIMLSGSPPFQEDEDQMTSTPKLFEQIVSGQIDFPVEIWQTISPNATDLVKKLLTVDPSQRLSVEQALSHPWIQKQVSSNPSHSVQNQISNHNNNSKKRVLMDETNNLLNQLYIQSNIDFNNPQELKKRKSILEDIGIQNKQE